MEWGTPHAVCGPENSHHRGTESAEEGRNVKPSDPGLIQSCLFFSVSSVSLW
jgi:hypothetical protein